MSEGPLATPVAAQTNRWLGIAFCFAFTSIFCLHYILAPQLLQVMTPMALGGFRGMIGGLVLAVVALRPILRIRGRKRWLMLIATGLFGFCLNQVLLLQGLLRTHPTNAAMISNLIPLASVAIGCIAFGTSTTTRQVLGLSLGLAVVAGFFGWSALADASGDLVGNSLILINVVSFAVAVNLMRILSRDLTSTAITAVMLLSGGIILAVSSGVQELGTGFTGAFANGRGAALFVFETIVTTAVGYWLNVEALRRLTVPQTTSFVYLQPPLTALMSYGLGGDPPPAATWVCFAGVVAAGVLTQSERRA